MKVGNSSLCCEFRLVFYRPHRYDNLCHWFITGKASEQEQVRRPAGTVADFSAQGQWAGIDRMTFYTGHFHRPPFSQKQKNRCTVTSCRMSAGNSQKPYTNRCRAERVCFYKRYAKVLRRPTRARGVKRECRESRQQPPLLYVPARKSPQRPLRV